MTCRPGVLLKAATARCINTWHAKANSRIVSQCPMTLVTVGIKFAGQYDMVTNIVVMTIMPGISVVSTAKKYALSR